MRCPARLLLAALVGTSIACRPEVDDDASRVSGASILAVRAEPAEARANETVHLTALYTDGTTGVADASLAWSFCSERRPLAEPSPVDPECLSGVAIHAIGTGARVPATVPREACRVFGPDRPLARPGEPAGRPVDPDDTGGFYQRGVVGGSGAAFALFDVRLRCALPSATQDVALDFERRYRSNENPTIAGIARVRENAEEPILDNVELRASPGETVRLRVAWPECAEGPCGGAEHYVSYDVGSRSIAPRRESMMVTWRATRGRLAFPRTGRGETEQITATENDFVAPAAGRATVFIVLRDARGGTAFRSVSVRVE